MTASPDMGDIRGSTGTPETNAEPIPWAGATGWVENRPSSGRWISLEELREAWTEREVALLLALRDIKLRYKQTFFGVAWALLQPLAGVAIFTLVFGKVAGLPHDGIPYPAFVYAGLVAWTYCSTAVGSAAQSLVEGRELITKIYFPRILAPLAAVLSSLPDLCISLLVTFAFTMVYGITIGSESALLPLWVAAAVLLAFALGLWLSALNVQYRDVRYALSFVLQLWFFASPVLYSSSLFDGLERYAYALNPMVGLLDCFRWSLLNAPPPPPADLVSVASGLAILLAGLVYFQRTERRFADVV